jgi:hypothetical protein
MSPPPVPILSQIDPIHTIPSYLSKIHFNIAHPSTSWSSKWALLAFPPISYMHSSSPPFVLHALLFSHLRLCSLVIQFTGNYPVYILHAFLSSLLLLSRPIRPSGIYHSNFRRKQIIKILTAYISRSCLVHPC